MMTNFDLAAAFAATASKILHRTPPCSSIRTVAVIAAVFAKIVPHRHYKFPGVEYRTQYVHCILSERITGSMSCDFVNEISISSLD